MVQCPECGKEYIPDLISAPVGFAPTAEPYQKEQLIIGICSDKCYDESISGTREPQYTYDEKGRRFENGERKLFADPPED